MAPYTVLPQLSSAKHAPAPLNTFYTELMHMRLSAVRTCLQKDSPSPLQSTYELCHSLCVELQLATLALQAEALAAGTTTTTRPALAGHRSCWP